MKTLLFAGLLAALMVGGSAIAAPADITAPLKLFVATNGNDRWSGRLPDPAPDGKDGPFASLEAARDSLRQARRAQAVLGPATVFVRGGIYRLPRPFRLEPQDSGQPDAPVTYCAYADEKPILSGGQRITGFTQKERLWEARVPEVAAGGHYFRQLFVNGQRRQRARGPNHGYYRVAGLLPSTRDAQGKEVPNKSGFRFKTGDLEAWPKLGDVNLMLMHSWEISIHPLRTVDLTNRVVTFTAPLKEWWTIGYWEKAQRFYVENARELLDEPGEWYLDRTTGQLTYWPKRGESLEDAEVVAPMLPELVRLAGRPDANEFVQYVTIRGLAFHHGDWELAPEGNSSTQAAAEVPAAIMADGALHCVIDSCEIAHVGTYGVWLRRGCKQCKLTGNRLVDLGAGGIRAGETQMSRTDVGESSHNLIENNHIYKGGAVYPSGVGIWVAQSSHNRIAHNDIHDLLYSGLSIGWNWNDATNRCHHNVIEFNHVHNLGHGVLSDAGLIYCLGASPGSVIRHNVFHDIWPYETPPFGWGIYLDATCSGYLVESNLVYNTRSGGLMYNNGGHEHVIRNNIFALSADYALWPYWEKRPNTFRHNLVLLTQGQLFVPHAERTLNERRNAKDSLGDWDHNLYWHAGGTDALRFFRRNFAEWQALGLDSHSVIADPQLASPWASHFAFSNTSPTRAIGFHPFNVNRAGLLFDAPDKSATRHSRCIMEPLPPPPAPPTPAEINDDFERAALDAHPDGATVDGEQNGASIRISRVRASAGQQSVRVLDSPGANPSWQPHFYYQPHITSGRVRQAFDLWLGNNALFFTEWRDVTDYPRNVGPSVTFDGKGSVRVGSKQVANLPSQHWVHVQIEARLGQPTFTLTLSARGYSTQVIQDLPFPGNEFKELHWLGFSSTAQQEAEFYLDNLQVGLVR